MSEYSLEGPKWSSTTITWSFAAAGNGFSSAISGAYQDIVRAAIARWGQVSNITFKEVPDSAAVDIRVGWTKFTGSQVGEADFSYTGAGTNQFFRAGTLVRLEDPSGRAVGSDMGAYYQGTASTLYQTVLHEIGHALGLDHSTDPSNVMYASVGPTDPDIGAGDIQGIQALYGPAPIVTASSATAAGATTLTTTTTASPALSVYRFFDASTGTQFLTASSAEKATVMATRPDLTYEGVGFGGFASGTDSSAVPVFRFFDTTTGTHFFTSSGSERDTLVATRSDLVLEPTTFYEHVTSQTGDVPVYRFFDKTDGTHFYTASSSERAAIVSGRADMSYEGVAFYAPTPTTT